MWPSSRFALSVKPSVNHFIDTHGLIKFRKQADCVVRSTT
jgi:hypothetical protein